MPIMRTKIRGRDVEIAITMDELFQILNESTEVQISMPSSQTKATTSSPNETHLEALGKSKSSVKMIDRPLPMDADVKQFILNQPDYRHTLFDVQKVFFDVKFVSRGATKRMYHKTFHQLAQVRLQIEKEKGGKFVPDIGEHRINQYVFQKAPPNKLEQMFTPQ